MSRCQEIFGKENIFTFNGLNYTHTGELLKNIKYVSLYKILIKPLVNNKSHMDTG